MRKGQITSVYETHAWVRRASWGGLLVCAILLLWLPGGFPPRAWRTLAQFIPQVSHLWKLRGAAILAPLFGQVVQSLCWLAAWGLFLFLVVCAIRLWRAYKAGQQQFKRELTAVLQRLDTQSNYTTAIEEKRNYPRDPVFTRAATLPGTPEMTPAYPCSSPLPGMSPAGQNAVPRSWQQHLALGFEIGSGWDAGITRKQSPNEDSLVAVQGYCIHNDRLAPFGLCVVADGMGGHADGQDASYLAVQAVLKAVLPSVVGSSAMEDELLPELLASGVQQANDAVYRRSQQIGANMGATITAALILERAAYVANVGDSRTYLYRAGAGLSQVTRDHSLVARLVEAGRIARDDVYTHPERNQVYRGLGDRGMIEVDCFTVSLQPHDCLLLCSDGLWEMVRDPRIEQILKQSGGSPSQASRMLVRAALEGGGKDNISVIVVHANPMAA